MSGVALARIGGRLATTERPGHNPAVVYLAGLAAGSRRTMRQALGTIAKIASSGKATAESFPWA